MPFKSEKQRRYLWANEPEIARDWTDTYGSRIQKNNGGITRIPFKGGGADAATRSFAESAYAGDTAGFASASKHGFHGEQGLSRQERDRRNMESIANVIDRGNQADQRRAAAAAEAEAKKAKAKKTTGNKWTDFTIGMRNKGALANKKLYMQHMGLLPSNKMMSWTGGLFNAMGPFPDMYKDMTEDEFNEMIEVMKLNPNQMPKTIADVNRFKKGEEGLSRVYEWERLSPEEKTQAKYQELFPGNIPPPSGGDGGGQQPWWMQQGYPSYEAWKAAQGQGTTTVAEEVVEDTPSAFQKSLNTGIAQALSPYYVGANPTAANIAWGQQFGVDPRTMYLAEGGPIRQRYFLGKLVKKIGRAAKKVIKSPLGKAALIGGLGWAAHAGHLGSWGTGIFGKDKLGKFLTKEMAGKAWDPWKLGIMGASVLPFFMGGGDDKEGEKAFDYDAAKNAYMNEIMRIKRGALAGTLDPNQFVYQGIKDGGRIGYQGGGMEDPLLVEEYKKYVFEMEEMGLQPMSFEEFRAQAIAGMASGGRAGYYAGGQSIPSEYTMEDARKTAMQDRLGGITEVMKQADLYRQGDVGQMYMAEGGPTQEAGIMDLGGVEKDYRETGGFVPIGKEEKADDVPARLSLNEFVMTADAVRGMGDGDVDKGAERMEDLMETLEVKGKKNQGAQDMFEVSERLSAVV